MNAAFAIAAAGLVAGLTMAACGGSDTGAASTSPPPTTAPATRPTQTVDAVFELDEVGFHLRCAGAGDTTVLLIPGWGAGGDETWSAVQPALAEEARACTYDRPGTGSSDAPTGNQTFETQVRDLRRLLEAAGEPGPYVVVGHSFGGAEAVTFAAGAPGDVAGVVLVDASPATWPEAVCAVPDDGTEAARVYAQLCRVMHDPTSDPERLDVVPAFEQVATITSLRDLPLTVVTAATRTSPGLAAAELARLNAVWDAGVAAWASLSSESAVLTVSGTGHQIQLERPDVVLDAVMDLLGRPAPA